MLILRKETFCFLLIHQTCAKDAKNLTFLMGIAVAKSAGNDACGYGLIDCHNVRYWTEKVALHRLFCNQ